MNRYIVVFAVVALSVLSSITSAQDSPEPIKDNSFLIEEAYNQPAGVVQHIGTVQHFASPTRFWGVAYTTEIPLSGMRHQLSWTVPFEAEGRGKRLELTDLAFHYRYQALDGAQGIAVSPRVSLILTQGDGAEPVSQDFAIQLNLPVSVELFGGIVCHANVGGTFAPNAEVDFLFDEFPPTNRDLKSYFAGGSFVWLAHPNVNALCEVLYNYSANVGEDREIVHTSETIVSPGIRFAINKPIGQFVPGIGIPIRMAEGEADIGIFGYLSFEHSL